MAFGDLRDQINGAIEFFTGTSSRPYPSVLEGKDTITKIIPENWIKKFPYSFRVEKSGEEDIVDMFSLNSFTGISYPKTPLTERAFNVFRLTLNPEELSQDEIFAINVTATQSGTVSEHNGIVFRDLVISGTTGVHPRRGAGGANNKGKVILASPSLKSGYEEFLELRNYFRAYAEAKRAGNSNLILIFDNQKDNELLIVEPQRFSMKKSASKATLYQYSAVFKVIGNYRPAKSEKKLDFWDKLDNAIEQVRDLIAQGRGIVLKALDILRNVEKTIDEAVVGPLRQLDLALAAITSAPLQVGHMKNSLINRFNNSLTLKLLKGAKTEENKIKNGGEPSGSVTSAAMSSGLGSSSVKLPDNIEKASTTGGSALLALGPLALTQLPLTASDLPEDIRSDFAAQQQDALNITVSSILELRDTIIELATKVANSANLSSDVYEALLDLDLVPVDDTKVATSDEIELLYGMAQIEEGLNLILAIGEPFSTTNAEEELNRINAFFGNSLQLTNSTSAIEVKIQANTSLENLSIQYLGTPDRWIDIVNLNRLKPPYLSDNMEYIGNPFVKKTGDSLLIPSNGELGGIKTITSNRYNENASEIERQMGVDLKLSDQFDLILDNSDDFALSSGGANLKQAIKLKISHRKNDLMYHPDIGLGVIVGEKTPPSPEKIVSELESQITSDPRVGSISQLQLAIVNNAISLNMRIKAKESDMPIPVELTL